MLLGIWLETEASDHGYEKGRGAMGEFRELKVLQQAKDLAAYIYKNTAYGKFSKDYRFRDQIRRTTISIASNIADGNELRADRQSIRSKMLNRLIKARSN